MFVMLASQFVGCGSRQYPMVTSLGDLRSERRISESETFEFQEVITLDGSNPTQQVGRPIHYGSPRVSFPGKVLAGTIRLVWPLWEIGDLNPSTAIPIEFGPNPTTPGNGTSTPGGGTYVRVGYCESPGGAVVREIARHIDEVQVLTLGLVDLQAQLAQARINEEDSATLDKIRTKISDQREKISEKRKGLHNLMIGKTADGAADLPDVKDDDGNDIKIEDTGVMIVRWATAEKGGIGLDAGDSIGSAGFNKTRRQSGYVILGGIEVSQLVAGSDLYRGLVCAYAKRGGLSAQPHELIFGEMLHQGSLGLTMYTLKAKDIAYASDLQTDFAARLEANLSKSNLKGIADIDSLMLKAELAQAADFSNMGALPSLTWWTKPYELYARMLPSDSNKSSKSNMHGSLVGLTADPDADKNAKQLEGWSTIYSVSGIPKRSELKRAKKHILKGYPCP